MAVSGSRNLALGPPPNGSIWRYSAVRVVPRFKRPALRHVPGLAPRVRFRRPGWGHADLLFRGFWPSLDVTRIARPVAGYVYRDRFVLVSAKSGSAGRFGVETTRRQRFECRRVVAGFVAEIPGFRHDGRHPVVAMGVRLDHRVRRNVQRDRVDAGLCRIAKQDGRLDALQPGPCRSTTSSYCSSATSISWERWQARRSGAHAQYSRLQRLRPSRRDHLRPAPQLLGGAFMAKIIGDYRAESGHFARAEPASVRALHHGRGALRCWPSMRVRLKPKPSITISWALRVAGSDGR